MTVGVGPGDEVITTAYSFFATAGSIVRLGARPVFVDIDLDTLNINAAAIEARITPKTRAILPVHLCGQMGRGWIPSRRLPAGTICTSPKMPASHRSAIFTGQRAGSMGHLGCFSFFPSKQSRRRGR